MYKTPRPIFDDFCIVWLYRTAIDSEGRGDEISAVFTNPAFEEIGSVRIILRVVAMITETDGGTGEIFQFFFFPCFLEALSHRFLELSVTVGTASQYYKIV